MVSALQLKRRIKTAQNVSKTTRAMQMIAASKLKRAQEAALAQRPYVEKLTRISRRVRGLVPKESAHPYLSTQKQGTFLLVLSPDKGLCGGLIANLLSEFVRIPKSLAIVSVGKKIERYAARGGNLIASFPFGTTLPPVDSVFPLVSLIDEYYTKGKVGTVHVLYAHFVSVFVQRATIATLLPITLAEQEQDTLQPFSLFEPSIEDLLPSILRRYLEVNVYQFLLESYLSEQAARMIAMHSATDNAKEIIEELTLAYNKVRQERITNEILDISGATLYSYE